MVSIVDSVKSARLRKLKAWHSGAWNKAGRSIALDAGSNRWHGRQHVDSGIVSMKEEEPEGLRRTPLRHLVRECRNFAEALKRVPRPATRNAL